MWSWMSWQLTPAHPAHPAPLPHWSQTKEKCTFFFGLGPKDLVAKSPFLTPSILCLQISIPIIP